MGFLQVHSTMTLGLQRFPMAPVELLQPLPLPAPSQDAEIAASLRYELKRGEPVRAILEPWEHVATRAPCRCTTASSR